jgi:hypothetical protein
MACYALVPYQSPRAFLQDVVSRSAADVTDGRHCLLAMDADDDDTSSDRSTDSGWTHVSTGDAPIARWHEDEGVSGMAMES